MKTEVGNQKLEALIKKVDKSGVATKGLVDDLKALRVVAKEEEDPLVTKVLRLMYEFIDENKTFAVEGQYDEDEEGNEYPLEVEDDENLSYLLNLLLRADHKINREEIKDYRTSLKRALY